LVSTIRIFGNFLATFCHSSEQLSSILQAQSGQAYYPGVSWIQTESTGLPYGSPLLLWPIIIIFGGNIWNICRCIFVVESAKFSF